MAVPDEVTLCKLPDQRGFHTAFRVSVDFLNQGRIREGCIFKQSVDPVAVPCVLLRLKEELQSVGDGFSVPWERSATSRQFIDSSIIEKSLEEKTCLCMATTATRPAIWGDYLRAPVSQEYCEFWSRKRILAKKTMR